MRGAKLGEAAWEHWGKYGFPCFPCSSKKRPLCKWGTQATTDRENIIAMFAKSNATAIGVAMGVKANAFAIDFDLYKEGGKAQEYKNLLQSTGALPETRIHKTQSGGEHWIYSIPKGSPVPRNGIPYEAVEIRGEGGYIIVPPTNGYAVVSDNTQEAPQSLIKKIRRANEAAAKITETTLRKMVIEAKSFHEALLRLAAKMNGRGEKLEAVQADLMQLMNASAASSPTHKEHDRWRRVMQGDELARLVTSAFGKYNSRKSDMAFEEVKEDLRKGRNKAVTDAASITGKLFSNVPQFHFAEEQREHNRRANDNRRTGKTQRETQNENDETGSGDNEEAQDFIFASEASEIQTAPFLIHGLIRRSTSSLLVADPKAGKTLLATHIGLCAAAGIPINDYLYPLDDEGQISNVPTFYFALESQTAIMNRTTAWCEEYSKKHDKKFDRKTLQMAIGTAPFNFNDFESKEAFIIKVLQKQQYVTDNYGWGKVGLIVIDTLTRVMPGKDQNSVADTSEMLEIIPMLRESGIDAHVMFIHHTSKSDSTSVRGSSNLEAEVDATFYVKKQENARHENEERRVIMLGVKQARDIDDMQRHYFTMKAIERKNSQGVIENVPVLLSVKEVELEREEKSKERVTANTEQSKEAFYEVVLNKLSSAGAKVRPSVLMTVVKSNRKAYNYWMMKIRGTSKTKRETSSLMTKLVMDSDNYPEHWKTLVVSCDNDGMIYIDHEASLTRKAL